MAWDILPKANLQYFLTKLKNKFLMLVNYNKLGAKNILPFPYTYGSGTVHGLTVTVNEDGSVTANGQPTQNVSFTLVSNIITEYDLQVGDKLIFSESNVENDNASAALVYVNPSGPIDFVQGDYELTVTSDMVTKGVAFILWFHSGVDLSTAVTFKPMLRLDTDPDPTWASPAFTNRKLTELVVYLSRNKSHVSANPSSTTGTLTSIEIDGTGYAVQGGSGGHTIKNDSGTALTQKDNLKFVGVYSANSGDDTVVNIVREMLEDDYDLLSADEKKGFIDVTDETDDVLSDVAVTGEYSDILNRPIMGENTFKVTRGQSQSTAVPGYWACMVHPTGGGNPTTPGNGWWHVISMDWDGTSTTNWISQLALATQDNNGVWYRKTAANTDIDTRSWTRLADADTNGYANVANLLNGFINPWGSNTSGSSTFTYDFYANKIYIVTLGGVGGNGAHFLNGSIYLVWNNENNTTGGLVVSVLRAGSYSISSSARAQSGTNQWTLTANTSVRWKVYPFLG